VTRNRKVHFLVDIRCGVFTTRTVIMYQKKIFIHQCFKSGAKKVEFANNNCQHHLFKKKTTLSLSHFVTEL
jgi:hypothetical protein